MSEKKFNYTIITSSSTGRVFDKCLRDVKEKLELQTENMLKQDYKLNGSHTLQILPNLDSWIMCATQSLYKSL